MSIIAATTRAMLKKVLPPSSLLIPVLSFFLYHQLKNDYSLASKFSTVLFFSSSYECILKQPRVDHTPKHRFQN